MMAEMCAQAQATEKAQSAQVVRRKMCARDLSMVSGGGGGAKLRYVGVFRECGIISALALMCARDRCPPMFSRCEPTCPRFV